MKNTGYSIKENDAGYMLEFFSMNSCTHEVYIIDTLGPYPTRTEAELARLMHREQTSVADSLKSLY